MLTNKRLENIFLEVYSIVKPFVLVLFVMACIGVLPFSDEKFSLKIVYVESYVQQIINRT